MHYESKGVYSEVPVMVARRVIFCAPTPEGKGSLCQIVCIPQAIMGFLQKKTGSRAWT